MAQTGVVAMGIFQLLQQGFSVMELKKTTTLFSLADDIEFIGMVLPGEKMIISGELIYLRKGNIKAKTHIARENGEIVCSGVLTGTGVKQ
jgi:3-hydroxyacyl-[acyl-carrier-protein] dehydratase